eukprot:10175-Chlamydomonas_euryale.AAC.13
MSPAAWQTQWAAAMAHMQLPGAACGPSQPPSGWTVACLRASLPKNVHNGSERMSAAHTCTALGTLVRGRSPLPAHPLSSRHGLNN